MATINFSKNSKLNKVLNSIYEDLLSFYEPKEDSINEIKRYVSKFPNIPDYNLYQYGNLLISNWSIRELYSEYKSLKNVSDDKIEAIYMRQVRYVADYILSNNK